MFSWIYHSTINLWSLVNKREDKLLSCQAHPSIWIISPHYTYMLHSGKYGIHCDRKKGARLMSGQTMWPVLNMPTVYPKYVTHYLELKQKVSTLELCDHLSLHRKTVCITQYNSVKTGSLSTLMDVWSLGPRSAITLMTRLTNKSWPKIQKKMGSSFI